MRKPRPRPAAVLLLALVVTLLPGCIAITFWGTEREFDVPHGKVVELRSFRELADTDLLHKFGEPDDRIVISESREDWVYDRGLRWNGIGLMIGLPLPLLIPVGRDSDTMHIENGVVTGVDRVTMTEAIHGCGWFIHLVGCHSIRTEHRGQIKRRE